MSYFYVNHGPTSEQVLSASSDGTDMSSCTLLASSGTSMSTPIVAGGAAMVGMRSRFSAFRHCIPPGTLRGSVVGVFPNTTESIESRLASTMFCLANFDFDPMLIFDVTPILVLHSRIASRG